MASEREKAAAAHATQAPDAVEVAQGSEREGDHAKWSIQPWVARTVARASEPENWGDVLLTQPP